MISYEPFFKTLEKKCISQYTLINDYSISRGTLDAMRKNKNMTLKTLEDFCVILDCRIEDIVEIIVEKDVVEK